MLFPFGLIGVHVWPLGHSLVCEQIWNPVVGHVAAQLDAVNPDTYG